MKRAMYRVWGKDGHRQKASWQKSVKFTTYDDYTIETWCYDKTETHDYIDIEVTHDNSKACDLYNEMLTQLEDGILECCNYGRIEKLKYSYYWSCGCLTNKVFNSAVASFESALNNYAVEMPILPYTLKTNEWYVPVFRHQRFTMKKEVDK